MSAAKKFHVFATPTTEEGFGENINLGLAETKEQAIEMCIDAGYTVIKETEGGSVDQYDAEDAPFIYSYDADGVGAISVTVKNTASRLADWLAAQRAEGLSDGDIVGGLQNGDINKPEWMSTQDNADHSKIWDQDHGSSQMGFIDLWPEEIADEYIGGRFTCTPEDQFAADCVSAKAVGDDGEYTTFEFADGSRCKIDADGNIEAA